MGRLRHARHVQHHRNVGWPKGRESKGHGILVVVGGGESPLQGDGGQAERHLKGQGCVMHEDPNRVDVAPLESRVTPKGSSTVRGGAVGKVPAGQLAGGLLYSMPGSEGAGRQ